MFVLRWALEIGRTARELLATTTAEDITEMMAFEQLEPFGGRARDFRAGQVCSTVANVQRDAERQPHPWSAADFMPALDLARQLCAAPQAPEDPAEHSAMLDRILFGKT